MVIGVREPTREPQTTYSIYGVSWIAKPFFSLICWDAQLEENGNVMELEIARNNLPKDVLVPDKNMTEKNIETEIKFVFIKKNNDKCT